MQMFAKHVDANIGVATGASGLVVIDVDPRNGGTVEAAQERVPEIANAPTVKTAGGGYHFYLKGVVKSGELCKGVDKKSMGGYVVAPPSVVKDRLYLWERTGTPPFLVSGLEQASERSAEASEPREDRVFRNGERNRKLFESLSRKRRKENASLDALFESGKVFSDTQCDPPLADDEIKVVAQHAYKYADQVPAYPSARSLADIFTSPLKPPLMLVNELIVGEQINMVCGAPMSGKSLFATEIGISLASGLSAFGNDEFSVPQRKRVAYIYGEQGEFMWENRAAAIAKHRGMSKDYLSDFVLIKGYGVVLSNPLHQEILTNMLLSMKIQVVIIDPLVALSGVEDENNASEVVRAVRTPLQRLADEHKITPIVVHHSTKSSMEKEPRSIRDMTPRGSGDLMAMLGSVVGLWVDGNRVKAMVQSRLDSSTPFELTLDDHDINSGLWKPEDLDQMIGLKTGFPPIKYIGHWKKTEEKKSRKKEEDPA